MVFELMVFAPAECFKMNDSIKKPDGAEYFTAGVETENELSEN